MSIPIGAALIDSALPYALSQAIGGLTANHQSEIINWLWIAGAIGLIGASLNFIGFRSMVRHEAFMTEELRQSTFEQLISKDHSFFVNQKVGSMTSRYIDFIRGYVHIQDLFIIRTLGFIITVTSGLVLVALTSWQTSAILLGLVVMLIIQIRWSAKFRTHWRHERKELVAKIHGEVADVLTNNLTVRSYAGEKREANNVNKLTKRFSKIYRKDIGFIVTEGSARVLLMIIVQVGAIAASVHFIQDGTMTLATGIFVLAYIQRIGSQLFVLSDIIYGYDQAFLDAQPMTEMLLTPNKITEKPDAKNIGLSQGDIKFNQINYRYDDGNEDVLQNVSLHIEPGQKVGLVGPSGAGKSTIVQLLLRFSDVTGGAILIDDNDLRDISQSSLRSNIAYVPQEPALFHRTIRENIAYGRPDASDEEVVSASKKANAYEFISKLPKGLDTIVGERGVKLSGGQRQRIAIARAILKDAPILVLDEATSALDSESEKLIQSSLANLMKGRTAIVIAHRLSTIAKLDRIVVLDNGKIIEDGTHDELLKANKTYARLWKHQSGGFIEE
ncbi:hypothetical protein CR969_01925 [Candidatus Saccharibacteria bacterium]|nr:MAG: hypothetical protein CR969_01925 [Candidatus Saccharibacteria bacterium]